MKNIKVHQSFVRHTVPSRLSRTNRSFPILAFIAVFAGCLLSGNVAHAQVNQLRFDFEDAPGTTTSSDNSLGGVIVYLGQCRPMAAPICTARLVQECQARSTASER